MIFVEGRSPGVNFLLFKMRERIFHFSLHHGAGWCFPSEWRGGGELFFISCGPNAKHLSLSLSETPNQIALINIIICFMGKQIRVSYVKSLSLLLSALLIIAVILALSPSRRAGEAEAIGACFFVRLRRLLTRCSAARERLACKTEQGTEDLRRWHLEKYDNL